MPGRDLLGWLVAVSFAVGPWAIAAWLLGHAWWRQAGVRLSALDGPARLLAAATATLPADRRDGARPWQPSWPRCRCRSAR